MDALWHSNSTFNNLTQGNNQRICQIYMYTVNSWTTCVWTEQVYLHLHEGFFDNTVLYTVCSIIQIIYTVCIIQYIVLYR